MIGLIGSNGMPKGMPPATNTVEVTKLRRLDKLESVVKEVIEYKIRCYNANKYTILHSNDPVRVASLKQQNECFLTYASELPEKAKKYPFFVIFWKDWVKCEFHQQLRDLGIDYFYDRIANPELYPRTATLDVLFFTCAKHAVLAKLQG